MDEFEPKKREIVWHSYKYVKSKERMDSSDDEDDNRGSNFMQQWKKSIYNKAAGIKWTLNF